MGIFFAIIGAIIGAILTPFVFLATHQNYNNDGLGVVYAFVTYIPVGAIGGAILGAFLGNFLAKKYPEKKDED
ncbi:hypothetical protein EON80_02015 [bacterium]|nr:MAG: hypothetical protein EON80_02015 [bacterium]